MAQTPALRLEKLKTYNGCGVATDDYNFTWWLRNQNAQFFFYSKPVTATQHWHWMQKTAARKDFDFYIIWIDVEGLADERVGTIAVEHRKSCEFLQNLCVMEKYRGRGIARWAITQLMQPGRFIVAQVKPSNRHVIQMYQDLGFWRVRQ